MSDNLPISNQEIALLASKASNLNERRIIIDTLDQSNIFLKEQELNPIEEAEIEQIVAKLSLPLLKNLVYSDQNLEINTSSPEEIKQVLRRYQLYQNNLNLLPESVLTEVIELLSWLRTYQSVIAENRKFSPQSSLRKEDIYYGRFSQAIEPFLVWLQSFLEPLCADFVDSQVITDIQLNLLNQLEISLAGAISADLSLYCYSQQIPKSLDSQEAYLEYCNSTFKNRETYHKFYSRFPVLTREITVKTENAANNAKELIQRLNTDRDEISASLLEGEPIAKIKSFKLDKSDRHAGGKTVAIIDLELANSQSSTIVYKPRCVQAEAGMQVFLETLNNQVIELPTYRVLSKKNYGYCEFIAGKNHVTDEEEIKKIHLQIGAYLAIFYILGGSDLHCENIIVSEGNAYICDAETILDVLPIGSKPQRNNILDSVYKTGMLDWPRATAETNNTFKIGGIQGGESYSTPFSSPTIKHRMTLDLAVEKENKYVEAKTSNRLYFNGELVNPQDYAQVIVEGFNHIYSWMLNHQPETIELINQIFQSSTIRFVNRATQVYAKILEAIRHPMCLVDPLQVDLVLQSLLEHQRAWDPTGELAELEIKSLWQWDIPLFTASADSTDLFWK